MTDAEQAAFIKTYGGEWLKQKYLDELVKTGSISQARNIDREWPYFSISSDSTSPGEFYVSTLYRFIEYRGAYLPYVNSDSLVFTAENADKHFKLKFSKNEKDVAYWSEDYPNNFDKYIKTANLDSLLNSIVLAGTYMNNAVTPAQEVKFNANGTIAGLDKISSYKLDMEISYEGYEQMYLNGELYFFAKQKDILSIYKVEEYYWGEEWDEYDLVKGDLLYTLTVKK
jgi:hypothetical protein